MNKNLRLTILTNLSRSRRMVQWCIVLMVISLSGFSQNVAINATLNPANPSAGLDIDFPSKGFLITRVALTGSGSFAPLAEHIAGMIVYNTATVADVSPGYYYNDGTKWISGKLKGTTHGDMQYWNGTSWDFVSGGIAGQHLTIDAGGNPVWSGNISGYATLVTDPATSITTTKSAGSSFSILGRRT